MSEASRTVANLIERKNPQTPVYGVKEFVCLSVTNFDPGLAKQNGLKIYKRLFDLLPNHNQKPFEKKFATLAARAVFESRFFSKKANL